MNEKKPITVDPMSKQALFHETFVLALSVSVCLYWATEQHVFHTVCFGQEHLKTTAVGPSSRTFSETSFRVTHVLPQFIRLPTSITCATDLFLL